MNQVQFQVEFDREEDGRWIAAITNLPGAMAYGNTREGALAAVEAIALRALAEKLENERESLSPVLSLPARECLAE